MNPYRHLFGPVPSRRLGRSLGVDLIPRKTCSLDCVFCQVGLTTEKTLERRDYAPLNEVLAELEAWLDTGEKADVVTLAGSGEPTLHKHFGRVLECIRSKSSIPAVLLSNGTLFTQPDVRAAATQAQIVKLSLSAWDQTSFEKINRPHSDLAFHRILDGYTAFRAQFDGRLWIEVFLIQGMNSNAGEVAKIARLVQAIAPDRVHLNTAVRPPAEPTIRPIPREKMEDLAKLFVPPAEVIADFRADQTAAMKANQASILAMLQRRPCTPEQISESFGMRLNEVSKYLGALTHGRHIQPESRNGETYYTALRK